MSEQTEVIKRLHKSAEQGDPRAQFNLGVMYRIGQGVKQNYPEAVKWYRLAADQGDSSAQYLLGLMCANGLDELGRVNE